MRSTVAPPRAAQVSRSLLRRLASGEGPDRVLAVLTDHVVEDLAASGAVVHAVRHGHLVTRASAGRGDAEEVEGAEMLSRPLLGEEGVVGSITAIFPRAPSVAVEAGLELFAGVAEVALAFAGRGEEGRGRRLSFAATLRKVTRVASGDDTRPSLQALVEDAVRLAGAAKLIVLERVDEGYVVVAGTGVPLDVLRADVLSPDAVVVPDRPRPETAPLVVREGEHLPSCVELVGGPTVLIAAPGAGTEVGATVWRWPHGSEPDDIDITVAEALTNVIGLGLSVAGRETAGDGAEGVAPAAFLALLSHELRTPLAVIKGAIETLQAHGEELDAAMRQRLADQIHHRVDQEIELVESLLSLSELEEGRHQLVREPFDLLRLAQRVAADHGEAFGRHVLVDGPDEAPIVADRSAVRQVLANLVMNALKFSTGPVAVTLSRRPRTWLVQVDDDGEGVPRDLRARIFERYVRGERATTARGVGVGLAVVRGFVELHGGRVGVANSPQGGARFWFELPDA